MEDHFFTKHGVVVGCVCVCWLFWEDSGALHVLYTLFPLLVHQLHLRPSDLRYQRLGIPVLGNSGKCSLWSSWAVTGRTFHTSFIPQPLRHLAVSFSRPAGTGKGHGNGALYGSILKARDLGSLLRCLGRGSMSVFVCLSSGEAGVGRGCTDLPMASLAPCQTPWG